MITRGVEWGPVGTWAGAIATVLVVITTALVALGYFDGSPRPVGVSRWHARGQGSNPLSSTTTESQVNRRVVPGLSTPPPP
jgi:hypothetical protein